MQYIENNLQKLYRDGIISTQDMDELKRKEYPRINLLAGSVAQPYYSSEFFTVKTAYEFIINNCPSYLDKSVLQSCDINNYLEENVTYDEAMSEKVREDILNSIPLANGMIQAGERIVDRGEIIDNHTYNVLRSLKMYTRPSPEAPSDKVSFWEVSSYWYSGSFSASGYIFGSFRLKILHNRRNALFLVLCVFVSCILTELCVMYGLFNVYILPFAIVPIVVRTFFDSRTALFTHLVIALICSLMVPFPHEFLLLQAIAGMVVTFSLRDLYERSQLIRCAFFIFMSYTLCYISLSIYQEADIKKYIGS